MINKIAEAISFIAIKDIRNFFDDPDNVSEFEQWKKERGSESGHVISTPKSRTGEPADA